MMLAIQVCQREAEKCFEGQRSHLNKEWEKSPAEVAKICGQNKSFICEIVKKKKFILVLLSHLKLQKLLPHCDLISYHGKGIKFVGGRHEPKMYSIDGNVLRQKAVSL